LIAVVGFAGNPDTIKIPHLKLNSHRVKGLIRDLIKEGAIRDTDVVLIGFFEENNEQYLHIVISTKKRYDILSASCEYRERKFMGYSKIFKHDCFVFGDNAKLFFIKKGCVQIPDYFRWLLSLNYMGIEDFAIYCQMPDSDGNMEKVRLHIDHRGVLFKYIKNHFVLVPR
jgi:hypothetical protein